MMKRRTAEKGSALVYILIAIALLAALTATFMDSSSQQTTSQNTFNTVTDLNSQVNFIRSGIQECVLTYPGGDAQWSGTFANQPYPIDPDRTEFLNPASFSQVRYLGCPGNNTSTVTDMVHAKIFGGSSGKFMPPPPNLFSEWTYSNTVDGVFFFTSTDKGDAFLSTALAKLDDQYSECEADIINNASGGSAMNISSLGASGPKCPANSTCFRIWMITQGTAIYPGDSDNDETACP